MQITCGIKTLDGDECGSTDLHTAAVPPTDRFGRELVHACARCKTTTCKQHIASRQLSVCNDVTGEWSRQSVCVYCYAESVAWATLANSAKAVEGSALDRDAKGVLAALDVMIDAAEMLRYELRAGDHVSAIDRYLRVNTRAVA